MFSRYNINMNMNLSLNKAQFLNLISESYTMREIVYDLLLAQPPNNILKAYAQEICSRYPLANTSEKIPAIKWLRENVKDLNHLYAFDKMGYEIYHPTETSPALLGLAAAKRFVERAADFPRWQLKRRKPLFLCLNLR